MEERLVDLDELVLRCRNERAKAYIAEAVACYRAGAFRACIVTTWVAVVYDVLQKLDELALAGDKNAEAKRAEFEDFRQRVDIAKSLRFERDILDIAKDQFELISPIEYDDLARLLVDRNRCAHPSMNAQDEIYKPTAELARYHLRNVVTCLLQHQPVQGKAALERLIREINSIYFPADPQEALAYFQQGPLLRPREALVRNFVVVLLKALLRELLDEPAFARHASALNGVRMMHRSVAEKTLVENLSDTMRTLADDKLPNAVMFLMQVPDVWQYVAPDIRTRIENFISILDIDEHVSLFVWALDFEPIKVRARQRIAHLTDAEVMSMIKIRPSAALADRALVVYAGSGSFVRANSTADNMIIPLIPNFTTNHIDKLLEIVTDNDDVRGSFQLIDVLKKILDRKVLSKEYVDKILITCGKASYSILRTLAEYVTEEHLVALFDPDIHNWKIHEILKEMREEKVISEDKYAELMKKFDLADEPEEEAE